jgi:glutamate decarboxylase
MHALPNDAGLPLVAFHLKDDPKRSYDEFHIAERLRMNGWVVPAYALAKSNEVCLCTRGLV